MLKDRVIFFHSVFFCCFESAKFPDLHRCIHKCYNVPFSLAAHSCENRYLEEIEKSGCTFDTCKLVNMGKNGLDFYIATRVGEFYGGGHEDQVAIISKDQGFHAVRDYWDNQGNSEFSYEGTEKSAGRV